MGMEFLSAVKMESYKSLNRSSIRLLVLFIALPLFYGIGNMMNSSAVSIEGNFSAVTFGSMCWGLLGLTGITNILFVILIANYFGKEKEEGQIKFILLEVCNRKRAIMVKYCSILLLILFSYILMYAASIMVYYGCIAGAEHGSMLIDGIDDFLICFSTDFLYLIQLIMIASIEVLLCMHFKSSTSLLLGIAFSMVFIVLQYVPVIKLADPLYIVDLFNASKISTTGVMIYGIVYLGICGVLLMFAGKKIERTEIK